MPESVALYEWLDIRVSIKSIQDLQDSAVVYSLSVTTKRPDGWLLQSEAYPSVVVICD